MTEKEKTRLTDLSDQLRRLRLLSTTDERNRRIAALSRSINIIKSGKMTDILKEPLLLKEEACLEP
jgi:hypothetical protein